MKGVLFALSVNAPIREPQTYASMLSGLLGLGVFARRRKHRDWR
jgi:hypothetical protein